MRHIVIIGAGASGLVAAIQAASAGACVSLIEHKKQAGKKILATGNGRCNYSNRYMDISCYYGNEFAMQVIAQFSVEETVEFFRKLGIWPKERAGYLYPASDQASAVLEVLLLKVKELGIKVYLETEVTQVTYKDSKFALQIKNRVLKADAVILAAGGKASPVSGSDGSGYAFAQGFGHSIISPVPALTAIHCREKFFKQLAGVRTQAEIHLLVNNKEVAADKGELQLTAYGISGIPVFQISRYAARAFARKQQVDILIDFMPDLSYHELYGYLQSHELSQYIGMFNKKLIEVLYKQLGNRPKELAHGIKSFMVHGVQVNDFKQAQVTCGGVDTMEIDASTMQSKLCSGLYFAGEIVDVDGICGGYNLQWAWSSGSVAGKAAALGK